jgi:hypothetical protein
MVVLVCCCFAHFVCKLMCSRVLIGLLFIAVLLTLCVCAALDERRPRFQLGGGRFVPSVLFVIASSFLIPLVGFALCCLWCLP